MAKHGRPALAGDRLQPQSLPVNVAANPGMGFVYRAAPGRFSRRRWLALVTAGQALGFMAPGLTWFAAWKLDFPPLALVAVVVCAGAIEGAVLGWSQWRVLREWQPAITGAWVRLTALAAAVAWACGMAPNTMYDLGAPAWASFAAGVAGAPVLLLSIGVAQWVVLREFVPPAWRWVAANVVAWFVALPPAFAGPALVPPGAPIALDLAVWVSRG